MIELTFLEFHEQKYRDQRFCLYVVKNGNEEILYVGISTNDVWERWFGWGGHMTWDEKVIYGESSISINIEDHLPISLQWKIQLWTFKDCLEFCIKDLPEGTHAITIHDIEPIMIQKLSPALNIIYNIPAKTDIGPDSKRELEKSVLHNRSKIREEISRFLDSLSNSPKTIFAYRNALEQFVKTIGTNVQLTTTTYIQFLLSLQDKSPSTQRVYTTAVQKFYKFCGAGDWNELQEATQRYRHKLAKRSVNFNLSEVEKVISYCESLNRNLSNSPSVKLEALRDRAFVLTLADTGLRISEACLLKCGDIDFNENPAVINGMGGKQVVIRISNRSIRAITDYLDARSLVEQSSRKPIASQPLFARHDIRASKRIRPITTGGMWKAIKDRITEAGVDRRLVRIQDFRHYFITMIYQAKGDIKLSQEFARHESISSTRRYAHSGKEADSAYDEIFNQSQK
jgi:site-specific recombinase XerD